MYFPLMTQMDDRRVLVVGGGSIACRKCALFADFGAIVRVVAPEFSPEFEALPQIERLTGRYEPALLETADLAVAATGDRAVNRAVSEDCRARRIPVNVVDDPALCSFIVPATVRRGDLTLAVCTGGKSPATAGLIRRQLEALYGDHMAERLELLGRIRELLLAAPMPPEEKRSNILHSAQLDLEQLRILKSALEEQAK